MKKSVRIRPRLDAIKVEMTVVHVLLFDGPIDAMSLPRRPVKKTVHRYFTGRTPTDKFGVLYIWLLLSTCVHSISQCVMAARSLPVDHLHTNT